MARGWQMDRGEEIVLGVSLEDELEDSASLTGTPTISIWEKTGSLDDDYTDRTSDFTIQNPQVNGSEMTDEKGRTIAVGEGVLFELTAADDPGDYEVRVEADADDGTHPVTVRTLRIRGPGAP